MSRKSELMEIRGIGEAKAESVLAVLEESTAETTDIDKEPVEEAYAYLKQNRTREARRRLEMVLDL